MIDATSGHRIASPTPAKHATTRLMSVDGDEAEFHTPPPPATEPPLAIVGQGPTEQHVGPDDDERGPVCLAAYTFAAVAAGLMLGAWAVWSWMSS